MLLVWASADNLVSGGNPKATHITEEKVHHIVKNASPPKKEKNLPLTWQERIQII